MRMLKKNVLNELDAFVDIFGGEEIMERMYHQTYKAYMNTKNGIVTDKVSENNEDFELEIVNVSYVDESKEDVLITVCANGYDPNGYCILRTNIPQAAQIQHALGEDALGIDGVVCDFTGNTEEINLIVPKEYFRYAEEYMDGGLSVVGSLYTVDNEVRLYEWEENLSSYRLLEAAADFEIVAPVLQHKDLENKDINIEYLYKLSSWSNIMDYYYDNGDVRNQFLHIPGEGTIKVSGININGISGCTLKASRNGDDEKIHQTASVTFSNNEIKWKFKDNWGVKYDGLLDQLFTYVTYTLEIKANAEGGRYTFRVTNKEGAKETNTQHVINRINIYRDCFAMGQVVSMEDGNRKVIDSLSAGEKVKTPNGAVEVMSVEKVKQVTRMVRVWIEDKTQIYVNACHPLETPLGYMCAQYLEKGMELLTEEGNRIVQKVEVFDNQEIELCVVALKSENHMYVNGFLVGDSIVQLDENDINRNLYYKVPEDWRGDYSSWLRRNEEV